MTKKQNKKSKDLPKQKVNIVSLKQSQLNKSINCRNNDSHIIYSLRFKMIHVLTFSHRLIKHIKFQY